MAEVLRLQFEGKTLEIDLGTITCDEGEECERLTGWSIPEWWQAFQKTRSRAIRWAVWLGLYRSGDVRDFASVNPNMLTLGYEYVVTEDAAATPPELGVAEGDSAPTGPEAETPAG